MIVATVARRGRVAVVQPYFEVAEPLTLGRRAMAELDPGELVAVEQTGRGNARLLTRIGSPADITAVMYALALDSGVADESPDRPQPSVTEAGNDHRVDLRDLATFTVDPVDARDYDDALSVEWEGDRPTVHVHIADVAAFVPAGSPLDLDAEERGTSVYLPGRVDAMLPEALSAGACSLVPGEDRPAVTVTLSPDRAPRFRRTLIRSDHRLTYERADAMLQGDDSAPAADVRAASTLASRWFEQRRATGSLEIETSEIEFTISQGRVTEARRESATSPAHRMIEELMVRANEAVAELLVRAGEPTLFRVHESAEPEAVLALAARLEAMDVPAPALSDDPQPAEASAWLAQVALQVRGIRPPLLAEALTSMVLRALQRARYDPRNLGHSGLASSAYCHFTSPIRRYPDLVCHRALLHRLGLAAADERDLGLDELALHCSETERRAASVERRGADICLAYLLHDRLEAEGWQANFAAAVESVAGFGAFVRFADVFEGLVPVRLLEERYELDRQGVALVSASGHRIRVGDQITVRVILVDRIRGRVTLEVTGWGRM